jgi:hypothetical protein
VINIFPRHRVSGRTVSAMAGLAAAVVLAITAFAGSANASTAAPRTVRQVACRVYTLNVFHGTRSETCYEGRGTKIVRISDVREITTGENSGRFVLILHRTLVETVKFSPKHIYRFLFPKQTELYSITITRT